DFQIVNGGQTANALFEVSKSHPDKISGVYLLVRVYETTDDLFKVSIALSTNTQTRISSRDLRSNDDIQKRLAVALEDLGYFYERKRDQHVDKPEEKRIDALRAGQTYLAYNREQPAQAKTQSDRIFDEWYSQIFNEKLTPVRLLTCVKLA